MMTHKRWLEDGLCSKRTTPILVSLICLLILFSCDNLAKDSKSQQQKKIQLTSIDKELIDEALSYCRPIPIKFNSAKETIKTQAKISLGKKLFFEPRLSLDGQQSCNSCHQLSTYGVNRSAQSRGHGVYPIRRNVPTVFNSSLHLAQNWDGRISSLENQAMELILTPGVSLVEGQSTILKRIQSIPDYQKAFEQAFPERNGEISLKNIGQAIASFERTLLTPAPFDSFLRGEASALSNKQKEGLRLVMNYGCIACHGGPSFGGGMFQKFGLLQPYSNTQDMGRYHITKQEEDKFVFKVPSLRNIAKTAPYFHDGKTISLKDAIKTMDKYQLGQNLSPETIEKIGAFLESLTGKIPESVLIPPALPK